MEYRKGRHTKIKIEYHFVWVTKYRYHLMQGDLALRIRELVRQTCERVEIHILLEGEVKQEVHNCIYTCYVKYQEAKERQTESKQQRLF